MVVNVSRIKKNDLIIFDDERKRRFLN